ncbi:MULTISPECIES: family 10 glycosylhydrolase [unclassified Spirosoma]|uniref:glycoside hydrolase family 10 protein n=1 Tax=unclassified Spirosoma TaxID=2621999 RepID=UPI000959B6F8|nr:MULTISPECIES: family 10 glycosylhydrolase [unclassified Spirosoma]MBN8822893.1 family 10 glycosylhydrolase [Spirosoma sp.]OJW80084.1 MAG: glycoside hydrolase [Spirosoma sp. 48-14]
MRSLALLTLLLGILVWISCRQAKPVPVATRRPSVRVPQPTSRPPAQQPVPAKTTTPKPATAVITNPVDTLGYDEVTFPTPAPPKREFRAVWIATVDNIDWPSKKGLPVADQQRELVEMFDMYQQLGLNAVIVQVRSAADAFYAKSSEPWSEWLTGQQGLAPTPFYDPMEFMIEQAHQRGLEFHAWFNLDRAAFSKYSSIAPSNIMHRKPEWLLSYGGKKLFNLGIPAVRTYIAGIVANVVREYDVDGIHFDDYFYPYAEPGQVIRDDATYQAYNNGQTKADWRRDNVNKLIVELRDSIRENKPWIKFGVSPFGIWKNQASDPEGSATNGGQAYYDQYADTRKWVREGLIDYIVPQVYFSSEFGRVPYKTLVDWWCRNTGKVHLYIGHGAYRVGRGSERDPGWWRATEFPNQFRYNRQQKAVQGSVMFSAKNLKLNPLAIRDSLQTNFYRHLALVPPMPWLDSIPPLPPRDLKAAITPEGVELFWDQSPEASDGDGAEAYLVYRFEGRRPRLRLDDPRYIVAHCIGEGTTRFVDKTADPKKKYLYAITALDRLRNESREMVIKVH